MYLKSLSIKNYRKYGEEVQTINFAHSKWPEIPAEDESEKINITEKYISKSSSLIVGKNNSGKSKSSPDSCVKCYTMFLPFLLIKIDVFS